MKSLILISLLFAAPAFVHAEGTATKEARKIDKAAKKRITKAQETVQEEICNSGEEKCTVDGKKEVKKETPKSETQH